MSLGGDRILLLRPYVGSGQSYSFELSDEDKAMVETKSLYECASDHTNFRSPEQYIGSPHFDRYGRQKYKRLDYIQIAERHAPQDQKESPWNYGCSACCGLDFVYKKLYRTPYYDQRDLVLRNLTAHEFVRGDAVSDVCGEFGGITLGHFMLMRAMWYADERYHMAHPGVWAGHRFDIVVKSVHEKAMADGPMWKDLTEEAISGMRAMWKEFGALAKSPEVSFISVS